MALGVERSKHAPLATAASGAVATIVNDAVMTPGDVVKQRLQIAGSPYAGVLDCIRRTYRAEGLSAFYRSYKTTVRPHSPPIGGSCGTHCPLGHAAGPRSVGRICHGVLCRQS